MKILSRILIALVLAAFAVPARAQIQSTAPELRFIESDQTAPLGRWRLIVTGDTFVIEKNTATAKDYTTSTYPLSFDASGNLTLIGNVALPSASAISWNSGDVTITHAANTLSIEGGNVLISGQIDIGDWSTWTGVSMMSGYKEWTGAADYYGLNIMTALGNGSAGTMSSGSFYSTPALGGSISITGTQYALYASARNYDTAHAAATAIANMYGVQGTIDMDYGNTTVVLGVAVEGRPYVVNGTFTDLMSFRARGGRFTAGTATNYYGMYIEAAGAGATITNDYGI